MREIHFTQEETLSGIEFSSDLIAVIGTCGFHSWGIEDTSGVADPGTDLKNYLFKIFENILIQHDATGCLETPQITVVIGTRRFDLIST